MKGMLYKDWILLRAQWKSILYIILLGSGMTLILEDAAVTIDYFACLAALLAIGTLSYDEAGSGYSYMFTLPLSRKEYVEGKYLLSLLSIVSGALIGIIICLVFTVMLHIANPVTLSDVLMNVILSLNLGMIMVSISIPTRIKYGSEKGRLNATIIIGIIFIAVITISRLHGNQFLILLVDTLNINSFELFTVIISVVMLSISYAISLRIIESKDF